MSIGKRVAKWRAARGWSQTELAERLNLAGAKNVRQAHITQLESEETQRPRYLTALARVLGLNLPYLEHGEGPEEAASGPLDPAQDIRSATEVATRAVDFALRELKHSLSPRFREALIAGAVEHEIEWRRTARENSLAALPRTARPAKKRGR
jgi:transcriptional regulator with XRE-family HTH domain